jgi:hypothetical protein
VPVPVLLLDEVLLLVLGVLLLHAPKMIAAAPSAPSAFTAFLMRCLLFHAPARP